MTEPSSSSSSYSSSSSSPSFHRWLNACSTVFPIQDSLPFKRRRTPLRQHARYNIRSPVEAFEPGGSDSQKKGDGAKEVWVPHPETEEELLARERAERWGVQLAESSPMIRFLSRHLAMVGCNPYDQPDPDTSSLPPDTDTSNLYHPVSPLGRIVFAACEPTRGSGFQAMQTPAESGILICANRIQSKAELERAMAHEMIHWWDHCRFQVNWDNLRHNACSEIRAASLSGDCKFTTDFARGGFIRNPGFLKQHQACSRRRAVVSLLEANSIAHLEPEARKLAAERAVDEVWEACWNDTRPFDEIF